MFVNREQEADRLKRVLSSDESRLVIIYGRRRCGKSTLLKRVLDKNTIYFSADMRETPLQIMAIAERIENFNSRICRSGLSRMGFSFPKYELCFEKPYDALY